MNTMKVTALPDCQERLATAREASWEIEALACLLRQGAAAGAEVDSFAVRGVSSRIKDLACIVMSAIDDESSSVSDLRYELFGVRDGEGGAA